MTAQGARDLPAPARVAACRCGALRATCTGAPVRVSVCHCLDCQRRSGSAFAVQARFPADRVRWDGDGREWTAVGQGGGRATFRFCPTCGATVGYVSDSMPNLVAVPVGAFADPTFPPPTVSGYEERRHPWAIVAGEGIEHFE